MLMACCHHEKIIAKDHTVHLMNLNQRQVAADLHTKPTDIDRQSAPRLLLPTPAIAVSCHNSGLEKPRFFRKKKFFWVFKGFF